MGVYSRKLHVGRKLLLYGEVLAILFIPFHLLAEILSSIIPIFAPDLQIS